MILYFSGSGNSRYAAEIISDLVGDDILSVNDRIKTGNNETVTSDKPLVFVCPVYAGRIPRIVEKYIKETKFAGNKKAYFVSTCYQTPHDMAKYTKKICEEVGFEFSGFASVQMPQCYIVMYTPPKEAEVEKIIKQAEPKIRAMAETIKRGEMLSEVNHHINFSEKMMSAVINPMMYATMISAKGFYATANCSGCGMCVKHCPLNNIKLVDKQPQWGKDCTHCMACIGGCPQKSIEYGKKTQGKPRYYRA